LQAFCRRSSGSSIQAGRTSNHDVAVDEAVLARRRTRALVGDDRF